ncbi:MAG TPA: DUF2537 domain-containing protein [Actinophytocola sp.]|nr:DUF2537 domain-containing protein [Actinophytocola sp.]HET9139612.1 DUF2537 domain-containing protein [Actinophytocola sp.]
MQLRAVGERAVLVGGDDEAEVDPGRLALAGDLSEALHEWARVAQAVRRSNPDGGAAAGAVVNRRGIQLAARLAASLGMPVGYVDPLTGEVSVVEPPEPPRRPQPPAPPDEPVPWPTGLTVSAFVFMVVFYAVLTLAITLNATQPLLAVGSTVVITVGLLPSVWLVRRTPIWRWVALGVAAAIATGWLALPFVIL